MSPMEFADRCVTGIGPPSGVRTWSSKELLAWLRNPTNSGITARLEMAPISLRESGIVPGFVPPKPHRDASIRAMNERAVKDGLGIFGHVSLLEDQPSKTYSVKYFLFSAFNAAHFPGGEGNHEGDWLCIDLQVLERFGAADKDRYKVLYAIYHCHGDQIFVPASQLQLTADGRPIAYLEEGTNEPHPNPGDDDYFKAVRPHHGGGLKYDTIGKVRNLESDGSEDSEIVRLWRGEWGEFDQDEFKSWPWIGHDVTNPPGPAYQSKMWLRSFSKSPGDPMPR